MKRIMCLVAMLTLVSISAFADIARPDKTPSKAEKPKKVIETTLGIRIDRNAKEARLLIPKSQIQTLRAALDQLESEGDATAAAEAPSSGSFTRTQTVVSGTFLSLALVFGGMWFVRSGRAATKGGKTLIMLVILSGLGFAATFVYANAGPPDEARSITGKMFTPAVHMYGYGSGKIKLEVSDTERYPELIVPDVKEKSKNDEE